MSIYYIDRLTGKKCVEKVYGEKALRFLYGDDLISKIIAPPILHLLAKFPFFSALYGFWQRQPLSKRKIVPFIKAFDVDPSEFAEDVSQFRSFNDFFIRKLKPECRPIAKGENIAVIPADGRYYFYQNLSKAEGFVVKNRKFKLASLLKSEELADRYAEGTMIIARLCPSDYHRFHFPCSGIPGETHLINGQLYSVNPWALKKNIDIFTQNKRTLCEVQTDHFGKMLYLEIGATNVGSITQTYSPFQFYPKGAEKGFFSFGASSLILLFEPDSLHLDEDLVYASTQGIEIKCLMGQQMGKSSAQIKPNR